MQLAEFFRLLLVLFEQISSQNTKTDCVDKCVSNEGKFISDLASEVARSAEANNVDCVSYLISPAESISNSEKTFQRNLATILAINSTINNVHVLQSESGDWSCFNSKTGDTCCAIGGLVKAKGFDTEGDLEMACLKARDYMNSKGCDRKMVVYFLNSLRDLGRRRSCFGTIESRLAIQIKPNDKVWRGSTVQDTLIELAMTESRKETAETVANCLSNQCCDPEAIKAGSGQCIQDRR